MEVRLDHYVPGMDLRQAVVVVVVVVVAAAVAVAVHTAGVGEEQRADGAATAVWWGQFVRSMAGVVGRRAQQADKTSVAAAVLVVGMGSGVH